MWFKNPNYGFHYNSDMVERLETSGSDPSWVVNIVMPGFSGGAAVQYFPSEGNMRPKRTPRRRFYH